jgi:hypothetical protein
MQTAAGRRVMWRFLDECRVFHSIFDPRSGSQTAHNAGRQDWGHDLMRMLQDTDPNGYMLMLTEAYREQMQANHETEAFHGTQEKQAAEGEAETDAAE